MPINTDEVRKWLQKGAAVKLPEEWRDTVQALLQLLNGQAQLLCDILDELRQLNARDDGVDRRLDG